MKIVQFAPNGLVFFFPVKGTALWETLFIPATQEEKTLLRGLKSISLTAKNYGDRGMILGNQAQNIEVRLIKSKLYSNWETEALFAEYREHCFSREQDEFLDA